MIPQVESVLVHYRKMYFHLKKIQFQFQQINLLKLSSILTGFKQKETDGHGFGHILGFPLMHKESFNCLLNCSV